MFYKFKLNFEFYSFFADAVIIQHFNIIADDATDPVSLALQPAFAKYRINET